MCQGRQGSNSTILIELHELVEFDLRKIAALVGVAPLNRDDGTMARETDSCIWAILKTVLHTAAL